MPDAVIITILRPLFFALLKPLVAFYVERATAIFEPVLDDLPCAFFRDLALFAYGYPAIDLEIPVCGEVSEIADKTLHAGDVVVLDKV
jgi:hypothetical protein